MKSAVLLLFITLLPVNLYATPKFEPLAFSGAGFWWRQWHHNLYRLSYSEGRYLNRVGVNMESQFNKNELRQRLTPLQYKVTQENGTERAFDNEYWDNEAEGIYVDIVSGEPLFSSIDKYESGTGWPSFSRPLESKNIVEKIDKGLLMARTEVRSAHADSHLGHVFKDGPKPSGLRYCINSASVRFIPKENLEKEGYAEFKKLFDK